MKYKIDYPENYKTYFTLANIDSINRIKKDSEFLQESIATCIDVFAGGDEVLKVSLEWCRDIYSDFFGDDTSVDIWVEIYTYNGFDEFKIKAATLTKINEIAGNPDEFVGCLQRYKREYK